MQKIVLTLTILNAKKISYFELNVDILKVWWIAKELITFIPGSFAMYLHV